MMEVPIIYKNLHCYAEEINGLVSIWFRLYFHDEWELHQEKLKTKFYAKWFLMLCFIY